MKRLPIMMMNYFIILLIQVKLVYMIPLQLFQQSEGQQLPQLTLQQQLMELQQLEALQQLNNVYSPMTMELQRMPLIIIPASVITDTKKNPTNDLTKDNINVKNIENENDEDSESVVIEAEEPAFKSVAQYNQNAFIVIPYNGNTKGIIGGIISIIPWLPFEVNVPDTISWIWNGISGAVSGIGQNLPFRPRPQDEPREIMKVLLKRVQNQKRDPVQPFIVLPLGRPMLSQYF